MKLTTIHLLPIQQNKYYHALSTHTTNVLLITYPTLQSTTTVALCSFTNVKKSQQNISNNKRKKEKKKEERKKKKEKDNFFLSTAQLSQHGMRPSLPESKCHGSVAADIGGIVSGDAPQLDSTSSPWMWTWEEVLVDLKAALRGAIWLNCTLDRQPVNPGVLYL